MSVVAATPIVPPWEVAQYAEIILYVPKPKLAKTVMRMRVGRVTLIVREGEAALIAAMENFVRSSNFAMMATTMGVAPAIGIVMMSDLALFAGILWCAPK